jgi:hypothetical protein
MRPIMSEWECEALRTYLWAHLQNYPAPVPSELWNRIDDLTTMDEFREWFDDATKDGIDPMCFIPDCTCHGR